MGSSVLRSGWSGPCCWDMDSASESCSELDMYSGSGQYSGLQEASESPDWPALQSEGRATEAPVQVEALESWFPESRSGTCNFQAGVLLAIPRGRVDSRRMRDPERCRSSKSRDPGEPQQRPNRGQWQEDYGSDKTLFRLEQAPRGSHDGLRRERAQDGLREPERKGVLGCARRPSRP